jgi:3-oxoadipate enol-lactonase
MPTIHVNGTNLYYEETGGGDEAVVFTHGLAWTTRLFRAQVEALGDRYRCIAYDTRGHGRSEVTRTGYELDNLAVDLASLIEELNAGPCHLVGHSLGGSYAVRVAARRPELVRSLCLYNAAADEDPFLDRAMFRAMSYGVQGFGMGVATIKLMKMQFGRTFREDPARAAERDEFRRLFKAQDKDGIARAVRGWIRSPAVVQELPRIGAPTLVVSGSEDTTIKPPRSKQIADAVQHGRFIVLPSAGHSSPVENPQGATAVLRDHLEEHAHATPGGFGMVGAAG